MIYDSFAAIFRIHDKTVIPGDTLKEDEEEKEKEDGNEDDEYRPVMKM